MAFFHWSWDVVAIIHIADFFLHFMWRIWINFYVRQPQIFKTKWESSQWQNLKNLPVKEITIKTTKIENNNNNLFRYFIFLFEIACFLYCNYFAKFYHYFGVKYFSKKSLSRKLLSNFLPPKFIENVRVMPAHAEDILTLNSFYIALNTRKNIFKSFILLTQL